MRIVVHLLMAAAVGIPVAATFFAKDAVKRDHKLRMPGELFVRVLFIVSRWFFALAQGSDSFLMEYRRHRHMRIETPACEGYRPWEIAE
ncbi:MAG: hypothetical protein ABFD89_00725 [Bryobacteraceae bacterium]